MGTKSSIEMNELCMGNPESDILLLTKCVFGPTLKWLARWLHAAP
jgi:hypothetical protein